MRLLASKQIKGADSLNKKGVEDKPIVVQNMLFRNDAIGKKLDERRMKAT